MEAVPEGIEINMISAQCAEIEGVFGLHHLHVWKLPSGEMALSAHVSCDDLNEWDRIFLQLHDCVATFGITHATFQPETGSCDREHPDCH